MQLKLARLDRLIKGDYRSDYEIQHTRKLKFKGGSSCDVVEPTYVHRIIMEEISKLPKSKIESILKQRKRTKHEISKS